MQTWEPTRLFALVVAEITPERAALKATLKEMRLRQIFEAPNASAALAFMQSTVERIDLIVYLRGSAGMTGVELMHGLSRMGADDPALVLIDEPADADGAAQALEAGVAAFLTKPFSPLQLEAKIRIALAQKHRAPGQ